MTATDQRIVCVVTGSRADYGHLYWLLREIDAEPGLRLQLVATGAHLNDAFGATLSEVTADGFAVDAEVDNLAMDGAEVAMSDSIARGISGCSEAFQKLVPDIVVLLGDRFEIFSAAVAAMTLRIPIAHIHGGELSAGAMDETMRHAITKMSHLHFVAAEPYARRVVQMGEDPAFVFAVGAPGLDHMSRLDPIPPTELEQDLDLPLSGSGVVFLVTFHPVTLDPAETHAAARALIEALGHWTDARIIITGVHPDPGHDELSKVLVDFAASQPGRAVIRKSLGHRRYLSLMHLCDVVIGNSSSGLIEAPAVGVPTVNIGSRQDGRLRGTSVIDCPASAKDIVAAIERALTPAFRERAATSKPPYGRGGASQSIKNVLASQDLAGILVKNFKDVPIEGRV